MCTENKTTKMGISYRLFFNLCDVFSTLWQPQQRQRWARKIAVSMAVIDVRVKIQQIMRTERICVGLCVQCTNHDTLIWNISLSPTPRSSFLLLEMCANQIFELNMCKKLATHTRTHSPLYIKMMGERTMRCDALINLCASTHRHRC